MKFPKLILCATLSTAVSVPVTVYSAPSSYSNPKSTEMRSAQENIKEHKYEAAIEDLTKIVIKDGKNADAFNLLGYSHRKLKQYDQALNYYQKALQLEPEHVGALEYLGELYVETNQLPKANQMLERIDDACFFSCKEYRKLKDLIDQNS